MHAQYHMLRYQMAYQKCETACCRWLVNSYPPHAHPAINTPTYVLPYVYVLVLFLSVATLKQPHHTPPYCQLLA